MNNCNVTAEQLHKLISMSHNKVDCFILNFILCQVDFSNHHLPENNYYGIAKN